MSQARVLHCACAVASTIYTAPKIIPVISSITARAGPWTGVSMHMQVYYRMFSVIHQGAGLARVRVLDIFLIPVLTDTQIFCFDQYDLLRNRVSVRFPFPRR